jgi:acyl-CoA thioesterase
LTVDFLAPARAGDVLTARAFEVVQAGRTGVYDITVTNQHGEQVAMVRGRAHRMKDRRVLPADARAGAGAKR